MLNGAGMIHEGHDGVTGRRVPGVPGLGGDAQIAETEGRRRDLPQVGPGFVFCQAMTVMAVQDGMNRRQAGQQQHQDVQRPAKDFVRNGAHLTP